MTWRLRVDPIACTGHGLCAEHLPEAIELDDWGYPILTQPEIPADALAHARRAAAACPTLALRLARALPRADEDGGGT
jgi:ferredoxin